MVPDVSTGSHTRGLLAYLYGPGRRDEHFDPHIVAAWDMAGAPDPGRDDEATLTQLAKRLDQYVDLRTAELGPRPPKHVWHCPVRTAPEDRYLTDAEWAQVAQRIVAATGIAPERDDQACRWIAVRHADDHIHILATTVRLDGRRARTHRDGQRAQDECRRIEAEFGLRQLKQGDHTAPKSPTGAEVAKARRQGKPTTDREWLRDQVTAALIAARSEAEFFSTLELLGIKVKFRIAPSGDTTGYSVAVPDSDVYFSGAKLGRDLSIVQVRQRLAAQDHLAEYPDRTLHPWQHAEQALRPAHAFLDADTDRQTDGGESGDAPGTAEAYLVAYGELLHTTAATAPPDLRAELRAAARAFHRATQTARRADHQRAAALRAAAKHLLDTPPGRPQPGDALATLLTTLVLVAIAAVLWHQARRHRQQADAARVTLTHLRTAYTAATQPLLTELTRKPLPDTTIQNYAEIVRSTVPDHAERILNDDAWPALAAALARAETAGHRPAQILRTAAEQRELDTADRPAHVLTWRITTTPSARTNAARMRAIRHHAAPDAVGRTPTARSTVPAPRNRTR
ncbi:mobilization protein [Yinghuangia sp. ASG 101]|uniref:relaxase/mobilization nuclease domain-containing protein n=1 Tax=Yinghuangia sp. ASG 101 TaxID=2896848 RepID=UPI001E30E01C|nr:mobilization protein [Yinghuangia sp. ASG 101]UGQ14334.1 mobilization protein [Yinghuangia sp. ASG 101]